MKDENKKINLIPENTGLKIVAILLILGEIFTTILVLKLNLLPALYVILICVAFAVIDFVILLLMGNRKRQEARIIGLIISIIMFMLMAIGCYYIYNTIDTLSKITGASGHYAEYDIIVTKYSTYEDIDDIRGKEVIAVSKNLKADKEAKGVLVTKEEVTYAEEKDCISAAEKLMEKGKDGILLLSRSEYEMASEDSEKFADNTEVLYRFKVEVPDNNKSSEIDVTQDSFNMLISGSDARNGIDEVARSDVNMLMTVNPKTHTILLTSASRDSYVALNMNGQMDKLTHTGVYGVEETIATIEDWFDIKIDFYARVDFEMLVTLVNAVGGIDVYNDTDFCSSVKGWHYPKGKIHLNGRKALWFLRERKCFERDDEKRIQNQQKVLEALIKKITNSKTIVANYTDILEAVEADMETDMSNDDLSKLAKMQLSEMPKWTIIRQHVTGELTQRGTYSMGPERPLNVNIPDEKSVEKCKKKINEVMYPVEDN